jgi:DNA-binding transcriptional MocR family regulator
MPIDPSADRAVYKQLADLIRAQIESGEFAPGQRLPAQKDYMQEHGISRVSVDRAMGVLRGEGLIVTGRRGSRVRPDTDVTVVLVDRGDVSARMPTEPERHRYGISPGVPVLIVTRGGQHQDHDEARDQGRGEEIYPADQVKIRFVSPFVSPAGAEELPGSPAGETNNEATRKGES